jgi:putative Mg2+ transporter-C (MgtC) family protein
MNPVLQTILDTLRAEFSDLRDVEQFTRVSLRLGVAVVLGAAIGFERERRESFAGLRTHMLVALGSALFVVVPQLAGTEIGDMSRVLQGVIAGIGFLGAGAVLKQTEQGQIHGLTTAASIWATAAIGVAVGLGREGTALLATLLVLVILAALYRLDKRLARKRILRHESARRAATDDSP